MNAASTGGTRPLENTFHAANNIQRAKVVPEGWAVTVYTITAQPSGTTLVSSALIFLIWSIFRS